MGKVIIVLVSAVIVVSGSEKGNADTSSEAYRKAIGKGDRREILRTQSYLAPRFCRIQGIQQYGLGR